MLEDYLKIREENVFVDVHTHLLNEWLPYEERRRINPVKLQEIMKREGIDYVFLLEHSQFDKYEEVLKNNKTEFEDYFNIIPGVEMGKEIIINQISCYYHVTYLNKDFNFPTHVLNKYNSLYTSFKKNKVYKGNIEEIIKKFHEDGESYDLFGSEIVETTGELQYVMILLPYEKIVLYGTDTHPDNKGVLNGRFGTKGLMIKKKGRNMNKKKVLKAILEGKIRHFQRQNNRFFYTEYNKEKNKWDKKKIKLET